VGEEESSKELSSMDKQYIWNHLIFDKTWNESNTEKFDNIYPSWERRRKELSSKHPEQYERFFDQLKRKQAIDTGIIEKLYDLKMGVTETFIKEGFVDSYLQHGDTDIAPGLLMNYLRDNFDAIDFIFDFVKNDRSLSTGYIKELHSLVTQHQDSTDAVDQFGKRVKLPLLKGEFKKNPNNPVKNGIIYEYCPPEQVDSEMDLLIHIYNNDIANSHVLVKAAFLHHYGYDNNTFAIGAFLSKSLPEPINEKEKRDNKDNGDRIDLPPGVPPLIISSEKDASDLTTSIKQQVEISIMAALSYIANELG